jgi:hypothetical protein
MLFLAEHLRADLSAQAHEMAILILDRYFPATRGVRSKTKIPVTVGATGLKRELGIRCDNLHSGITHRLSVIIGGGCAEGFAAASGLAMHPVGLPPTGQEEYQTEEKDRQRDDKPRFNPDHFTSKVKVAIKDSTSQTS